MEIIAQNFVIQLKVGKSVNTLKSIDYSECFNFFQKRSCLERPKLYLKILQKKVNLTVKIIKYLIDQLLICFNDYLCT